MSEDEKAYKISAELPGIDAKGQDEWVKVNIRAAVLAKSPTASMLGAINIVVTTNSTAAASRPSRQRADLIWHNIAVQTARNQPRALRQLLN